MCIVNQAFEYAIQEVWVNWRVAAGRASGIKSYWMWSFNFVTLVCVAAATHLAVTQ